MDDGQEISDEEWAEIEAKASTMRFKDAVAWLDRLHAEGRGESDEAEIVRNCPAINAGRVILRGGQLELVEGDE